MREIRKILKEINSTYFFIPFIVFAILLISYLAVQSIFFSQDNIFPKGARYVPDQIIVNYKEGQSPEELILAGKKQESEALVTSLSKIGVVSQKKLFTTGNELIGNYYVLNLKKGASLRSVYQKLTRLPQVKNAAPDYILKIQDTPNDPYFTDMWNLKTIRMENAWNLLHANGRVVVAVVDTGVDYNHEDLQGIVLKGKNFIKGNNNPMDDQGHGTHVAGILGAVTNNSIGVSGVSWGSKILAVKACDKNGDCATSNVARAIQYVVDSNVKIINVSIAGAGACNGTYTDTIAYALKKGALIITAAGNGNNGDGKGVDASTQIPAGCDGVLAVGSVTASGSRSPFSNYGSKVEISAPGGVGPCSMGSCILSTSLENGYTLRAGTSMAAPQVSGVAALILASNSALSMSKVKTCLVTSGDPIQTDEPIGRLLNAAQSIKFCQQKNKIPTPTVPFNASSAISGTVYIDKNGNNRLDKSEKPFSGAQVVLSGLISDSVISNSKGKYFFPDLSSGLYTVSLTINGKSVDDPVDITLSGRGETVIFDFPVPPSLAISPTPPKFQRPASECHLDPSCLDTKNAFQICSFQCP